MRPSLTAFVALLLIPWNLPRAQGTVYLVLGSDTGIWDGMNVASYHCTYAQGLFTDPAGNAARVMDPGFRLPLTDSYGTPVRLTWWMMAGNIFRRATNTNVPDPNTMTMYLMKKYRGESIARWGDELTLHYHTFVWTDYDGDGKYYWNQAFSFNESADDFDVTLAGMLLEEETFPVSFRSGWHAMDNGWQQKLDTLLPYSMHNDWPAKHVDLVEPLDNTYDWSRAPSEFVPFHPSMEDYQVPGAGRGWNLRSSYMASADSAFMDRIFLAASAGKDQVACLWAHLPETDFPDNVRKVDAAAHKAVARYPGVRFRYCTAVEAMQRWRGVQDTAGPRLTFSESTEGGAVRWSVTTDEPIFQTMPFVAVKDRYGEYRVLACRPVGERTWETSIALPRADLAKAGVAVTDTAGNLSTAFLRYLPDDIYVDDADPGYAEQTGSWTSSPAASWGTSSRVATPGPSDSVTAEWTAPVVVPGLYSVFAQIPALAAPVRQAEFRLLEEGSPVGGLAFSGGIPPNRWVYLGTRYLSPALRHSVRIVAKGGGISGLQAAADVVRYTALVRERWLEVPEVFDAGEVIINTETARKVTLRDEGILPVNITSFQSVRGLVTLRSLLPLSVPAMGEMECELGVRASAPGPLVDTLIIGSDDPRHALVRIPVHGTALNYFAIVDDRDSLAYTESGTWSFSVARAYGPTSRYAYPGPGVSAAFAVRPGRSGVYHIQEIVPTTVNASVRARYVLRLNGQPADSAFLDQNAGSGAWVTVLDHVLPAGGDVRLEVSDAMAPVISGKVLRADAIRFQWISDDPAAIRPTEDAAPAAMSLEQNYPNPFNASTMIAFDLPGNGNASATDIGVKLTVCDLLGREVAVLVNGRVRPGSHGIRFDATGLSSGVYIYRMQAGDLCLVRKMILIR